MITNVTEEVISTNTHGIGNDHASESPMNILKRAGDDGGSGDVAPEELEPKVFVNTGLKRWENLRKEWVEQNMSSTPRQRHAKEVDVDEIIDLVVSNRWRQQAPPAPSPSGASESSSSSGGSGSKSPKKRDDACFQRPVALPQMIDILVDLWEAEGLDI